jgi:hypothetical protein
VRASTGNGGIDVRMDGVAGSADTRLRTGNGPIVLRLPADFSGEVEAKASRLGFSSDFALRTRRARRSGPVRGVIGEGGPRLMLSTGRGPIQLRKIR